MITYVEWKLICLQTRCFSFGAERIPWSTMRMHHHTRVLRDASAFHAEDALLSHKQNYPVGAPASLYYPSTVEKIASQTLSRFRVVPACLEPGENVSARLVKINRRNWPITQS